MSYYYYLIEKGTQKMNKMMKKVLLGSIMAILVLGLVGCGGGDQTITSKDKKFEVKVPKEWELVEDGVGEDGLVVADAQSESDATQMVVIMPIGEPDMFEGDLEDSFDEIFGSESGTDTKKLSTDKISGFEAITVEIKSDDEGTYIAALIKGEKKVYMVNTGAKESKDYDQKKFEKIAKSVKIKE